MEGTLTSAGIPPGAARPSSPAVLAPGSLSGVGVLVTGAGTGIGRAIALRLAALGAEITGAGRHLETLDQTGQLAREAGCPGTFIARVADVRIPAAAGKLVAEAGNRHGLDVLVNNAGGQFVAPVTELSDRGIAAVLDLNLTAVARLIALARPWLAVRRGVVVTLGLSVPERGIPGLAHSAAARAGISALTADLQRRWAPDGIDLHCLAPGTVLTDGVRRELTADALARVVAATPLARDTEPEEVAEWVAVLAAGAGPAGGGRIELDGGAGVAGAVRVLA